MNKKGFISIYFLYIFISVISVVMVAQLSNYHAMKTVDNIEKMNRVFIQELNAIKYVQCEIANKRFEDGEYEVNDTYFNVAYYGNTAYITIYSPYNEEIIVDYDENKGVIEKVSMGIYDDLVTE